MLRNLKWARIVLITLLAAGLLSGSLAWAKKPPKPPPEPPPLPPFNYEITWLTSPLGTYPIAWDIDNHGNVVGATGGGGMAPAFLYSPENGMQDLNDLAGPGSEWILTDAFGINDSGQVVGLGNPNAQRGNFGFRFTPGFVDEQGTYVPPVVERMALSEATHSVAGAINDLGEVVGESHDAAGNKTVFVYSDSSGPTDLEIEAAVNAFYFGINNLGQVVGTTMQTSKRWSFFVAFRYTPGQGIETTTLFNDPFSPEHSFADDINDAGQFTGAALPGRYLHAYRFADQSGMVDLDEGRNTSHGRCINSHGDIAGERQFPGVLGTRAFLYTEEFGMVNLDDLVVGTAEDLDYWTTYSVFVKAINDSRQICGYVEGDPVKAFVLTPVPAGN
jgi:probable HAF family extracellular repeat protein